MTIKIDEMIAISIIETVMIGKLENDRQTKQKKQNGKVRKIMSIVAMWPPALAQSLQKLSKTNQFELSFGLS